MTVAVVAAALATGPATSALAADVVGKFNEWTLYSNADKIKICFLAAAPSATEPAGLTREPALFYISAWPNDGVKSELSVKLGFTVKKGGEPAVAVSGPNQPGGSATFKMFVKDDRAYVADATSELKLLDALKKGGKLTVQAISERGTAVTDTYGLVGITAALQALGAGCK